MIRTYIKVPTTVSAIQWTGDNLEELQRFCHNRLNIYTRYFDTSGDVRRDLLTPAISLSTMEGEVVVILNNYVVKGVNGEFFTCDREVFERLYTEIEL